MITIDSPLKRDEIKRIITENFGEVEIKENGMTLSFQSDLEEEKFTELKSKIKNDPITKLIICSVKRK